MFVGKQDQPALMPWNLRYLPVVKQTNPGQGVLPPNYRPASNDDVPPGRNCLKCVNRGDDGMCRLWAARVEPDWYCDRWAPISSRMGGEMAKHGDHDQKSHGRRGGFSGPETSGSVFQQVMSKPEDEQGISINIMGKQPTSGYMVAFQGAWQPVPEKEFRDNGRQVIRDYLRKHSKALGGSEKTYMGIWFNTDTRTYEFDLSEQVMNKRKAISIGRAREQEAAWDVKRNEPVTIGARDADRQAEIDGV